MDIKTLISLKTKIESLSFKLNNFNFLEKSLMFIFGISIFVAFLFIGVSFIFWIDNSTFLFSFPFMLTICSLIFISMFFIFKSPSKKKSKLFRKLHSSFITGLKFNSSKYIQNTIDSLTTEEITFLESIYLNKKENELLTSALNKTIIDASKNINKKELSLILNSINDKELKYEIIENYKNQIEEEIKISKNVIKSI
tara:strand:- start:13294 stop:13884 length:591 start_codon:yes stop_codon:yes gene_type:complete